MKRLTLLLIIHLILFGINGLAYSNGSTSTEVVVFDSPSIYPRDAPDDTIPGTVRIFNRPTYCHVIFELEDESTMPGISVNYPVNDRGRDSNKADLELRKADNVELDKNGNDRWEDLGNGRLKYTLKPDYPPIARITNVPIKIYCKDYGGYAQLKAKVFKRGEPAAIGEDKGSVPRDENENNIPDGFKDDFLPKTGYLYINNDAEKEIVDVPRMKAEKARPKIEDYYYDIPQGGDRHETVDSDRGIPNNEEHGDSLTNFEEYRGVILKAGDNQRYDPRTKDAFYAVHKGETVNGVTYEDMTPFGYGNVNFPDISFNKMHKDYLHKTFEAPISVGAGWINTNSGDTPDTEYAYAIRIRDWGDNGDPTSTLSSLLRRLG